ncbi:hypothetical protein PHYSODRAFT_301434 [Phytophthora sojae]|uniref:Uncharacterized protein n=1 Tax=Phytophthora sojae (strain P6497) TaxID=1094619 RepID=G4ZDS4_PHYSP|nr:hypothetical protein PHYSODRAFT_301434 [Phytophthora sojae]EGZ19003.1 hypothetical protein PHYSODRAFT_301434 [Phytophthora sojae]|eukprot:XP_009528061.1 hypothetical protein PHYSODRAFT_301434 [Phytophthora sojae]
MVRLVLLCAFMRMPGRGVFLVKIGDQQLGAQLYEAVKEKLPESDCPADTLKLYLAQDSEGKWIECTDELVVAIYLSRAERAGVLHVAVLLPDHVRETVKDTHGTRPMMPIFDNGATSRWLEKFRGQRVSTEDLPPVSELEQFLQGPLPVKIGAPEALLDVWIWSLKIDTKVLNKTFEISNSEPCVGFLDRVWHHSADVPSISSCDTKFGYISLWDGAIHHILEFVLRGSNRWSSRYSIDGVPDYTFFIDSICVLRGEEEGPTVRPVDSLPRAPFKQVRWFHGDVPYLFGYAADLHSISLYALTRAEDESNAIRTVRTGGYNLQNPRSRFRLLLAVLNMARLLQSIADLCPASGAAKYAVLHRPDDVKILLEPTHVTKTFLSQPFLQAALVYTVLEDRGVPATH